MNVSNCCFKCSCTALAVILSLIIGIFGAFFQFSGVFTVTTTFLWVTFGVAVGVLALLAVVTAVSCRCQGCASLCSRNGSTARICKEIEHLYRSARILNKI